MNDITRRDQQNELDIAIKELISKMHETRPAYNQHKEYETRLQALYQRRRELSSQ